MPLTKYLAGKSGIQERVQYNKILGEIQRIGWEIQRINDHARALAQSLTEAFASKNKVCDSHSSTSEDWSYTAEKPVLIPGKNAKSCILL